MFCFSFVLNRGGKFSTRVQNLVFIELKIRNFSSSFKVIMTLNDGKEAKNGICGCDAHLVFHFLKEMIDRWNLNGVTFLWF